MNRTIFIATAVALASLTACGGNDISASVSTDITGTTEPDVPDTAFGDAAEKCTITDAIADGGNSLIFDTEGEDEYEGHAYLGVVCVLVLLDMPESVMARLDNTRALDGTQTAEWNNYSMTWNYHPDSGLNLIVEEL